MCGRFNVSSGPLSELLLELVGMRHPGPDNFNAAPTETIKVLRIGDDGEPELVAMRWWLTPYWAKDMSTRYSMFNAKSETVDKSAAFKEPFRKRRCVVPVSGFYEWARAQAPARVQGQTRHNSPKLPYFIKPHQCPGMLLAGVWDRWRRRDDDSELLSFAVLTTDADPGLAFVHNRQPVMLSMADAHRWLDPGADGETLKALCRPALPLSVDVVPVSTYVNNARNKDARCVEPIGDAVYLAAGETA